MSEVYYPDRAEDTEMVLGGGVVLFGTGSNIDELATVEFEAKISHTKHEVETTKGKKTKMSKFIGFEGNLTSLVANNLYYADIMGIDAVTSVEETYLDAVAGTEAEQTPAVSSNITVPTILKLTAATTGAISAYTVAVVGKDKFGNVLKETFEITKAGETIGNVLFKEITTVTISAEAKSTDSITLASLVGVKSGSPSQINKFFITGSIKSDSGLIQGITLNNVMFIEKPSFKTVGKEEPQQQALSFVVANPSEDVDVYSYIPPELLAES